MLPEDETIATIYTPDIPSDIVHSILCLLYTGQANVTWRTLQDINECFRLIGRFFYHHLAYDVKKLNNLTLYLKHIVFKKK